MPSRGRSSVSYKMSAAVFSSRKRPSNDTDNEVAMKRKQGMKEEKEVKHETLLKLTEFIEKSEDENFALKQCQEKRQFVNEPYNTKWLTLSGRRLLS